MRYVTYVVNVIQLGVLSKLIRMLHVSSQNDMADAKHVFVRAIVCKDVSIDLIIGLPSIQYFDLLPVLQSHLHSIRCCESYAQYPRTYPQQP